jgi:amino acid transporter
LGKGLPLRHASGDEGKLKRGLKPLGALALMFALSSGGPYGLEVTVPAAGPGLAMLVLAGMALVWALPYVLITAELASAIPEEGGGYKWYRAFLPPFWAFQFSCLDWLTWVLDAAIYPPLLAAYLLGYFAPDAGPLASWGVCLVVIWGCTLLNVWDVRLVGQVTVLLSAMVLAPVVILVVLGLPQVELSNLQPFLADGTDLSSGLKYAFIFGVWAYSGYAGLAYASGEIVDSARTYPKLLAIILPLTVAVYVLPMLVALGATPDWQSWQAGHFNQVALVLGGTWLALLTSIGAQCGNLSLFNSELLITSRLPYAMAKDGVLPPFFAKLHPRHGTPARFLMIQAVFYSVMTYFFDFVEILVVSTWIAVPAYLLMFAAPIVLRIRRPELRGPFRVPGGLPVLVLCALPPSAIVIYVLFSVSSDEFWVGLGFIALAPLLYFWSSWSRR